MLRFLDPADRVPMAACAVALAALVALALQGWLPGGGL